jgi:hypothetical protein
MDGCGFNAGNLNESIFTQADTWEELRHNVQEATSVFFYDGSKPAMIRLHLVRDEVLACDEITLRASESLALRFPEFLSLLILPWFQSSPGFMFHSIPKYSARHLSRSRHKKMIYPPASWDGFSETPIRSTLSTGNSFSLIRPIMN